LACCLHNKIKQIVQDEDVFKMSQSEACYQKQTKNTVNLFVFTVEINLICYPQQFLCSHLLILDIKMFAIISICNF